jgi:hypothetical protein
MAFTTKALSFFYKRLGPTGSIVGSTLQGNLQHESPNNWWNSSSINVSSSFLNYPTDGTSSYITTRNSTSNVGYRALPWGSQACDFLWNVQVPVWSYKYEIIQQTDLIRYKYNYYGQVTWTNTYGSESFHKSNYPGGSSYGVSTYPVTSSWKMVEGKLTNSFYYITGEANLPGSVTYNSSFIGSGPTTIPPPSPTNQATDTSYNIAYDITYPNITNNATSSIDKQYFDVGTGAGITQNDVSSSAADQDTAANDNTANGLAQFTQALKKRRLYFPVPVSGSGTTGGTDYWFKTFTGYTSAELFNENGGIYNVQFTLKKWASDSYEPDLNSYLTAFIHNVIPQAPSSSARIPGADGWYPPENNIVRIGNSWNGTPVLSFYDAQTGYLVEKFNFNLIQYGYPAQFCLEPSTSVSPLTPTPADFSIIVSDIEICKIGVTTDPKFIKPTTVTQTTINQTTGGTTVSDPYIPPAP